MKTKYLSENVLVVQTQSGKLPKWAAFVFIIVGLLLMASLAGLLLGTPILVMGLAILWYTAFSKYAVFDKKNGWIRTSRRFLFWRSKAKRILLSDIDRIEVVAFTNSSELAKADDMYFSTVKRLLNEQPDAYSFVFNIGIRDLAGNWELLCHDSSTTYERLAYVAQDINRFLEKVPERHALDIQALHLQSQF